MNRKHELARAGARLPATRRRRACSRRASTLADPARIDVRGALTCGRDVSIDVNCVFEGKVTLGDGVRIGPNCVLRNVAIAAGTEVLAVLASRGRRGRRALPHRPVRAAAARHGARRGRAHRQLRRGEGEPRRHGSKANHLAYIGDAEVGARVNIGAGTITCNYDGANKHRTVIEDDCFIGSDAQLVAPVRIAQRLLHRRRLDDQQGHARRAS